MSMSIEWTKGIDGSRMARRKALDLALGQGVMSAEEKQAIATRARTQVMQDYRRELNLKESKCQGISRALFREYVNGNMRDGFINTKNFVDWIVWREEKRNATKAKRKEWVEAKNLELRRKIKAGSKVARCVQMCLCVCVCLCVCSNPF